MVSFQLLEELPQTIKPQPMCPTGSADGASERNPADITWKNEASSHSEITLDDLISLKSQQARYELQNSSIQEVQKVCPFNCQQAGL